MHRQGYKLFCHNLLLSFCCLCIPYKRASDFAGSNNREIPRWWRIQCYSWFSYTWWNFSGIFRRKPDAAEKKNQRGNIFCYINDYYRFNLGHLIIWKSCNLLLWSTFSHLSSIICVFWSINHKIYIIRDLILQA